MLHANSDDLWASELGGTVAGQTKLMISSWQCYVIKIPKQAELQKSAVT